MQVFTQSFLEVVIAGINDGIIGLIVGAKDLLLEAWKYRFVALGCVNDDVPY
jgi:hypothetical protein